MLHVLNLTQSFSLPDHYQWFWLSNPDDTQNPFWSEYNATQNELIEASFQLFLKDEVQNCVVDIYRIEFQQGIQINILDPSKRRPLRREGKFSFLDPSERFFDHSHYNWKPLRSELHMVWHKTHFPVDGDIGQIVDLTIQGMLKLKKDLSRPGDCDLLVNMLNSVREKDRTTILAMAVKIYTENTCFFKFLNSFLRQVDIDESGLVGVENQRIGNLLRPYIHLLHLALHQPSIRDIINHNMVLYRGLHLNEKQLKNFESFHQSYSSLSLSQAPLILLIEHIGLQTNLKGTQSFDLQYEYAIVTTLHFTADMPLRWRSCFLLE